MNTVSNTPDLIFGKRGSAKIPWGVKVHYKLGKEMRGGWCWASANCVVKKATVASTWDAKKWSTNRKCQHVFVLLSHLCFVPLKTLLFPWLGASLSMWIRFFAAGNCWNLSFRWPRQTVPNLCVPFAKGLWSIGTATQKRSNKGGLSRGIRIGRSHSWMVKQSDPYDWYLGAKHVEQWVMLSRIHVSMTYDDRLVPASGTSRMLSSGAGKTHPPTARVGQISWPSKQLEKTKFHFNNWYKNIPKPWFHCVSLHFFGKMSGAYQNTSQMVQWLLRHGGVEGQTRQVWNAVLSESKEVGMFLEHHMMGHMICDLCTLVFSKDNLLNLTSTFASSMKTKRSWWEGIDHHSTGIRPAPQYMKHMQNCKNHATVAVLIGRFLWAQAIVLDMPSDIGQQIAVGQDDSLTHGDFMGEPPTDDFVPSEAQ